MFSQFRQAVENLAPLPRSSDEAPGDARREAVSRSNSLDAPLRPSSPMSSSQLAESALSNLRKSLAIQRSGSVGSPSKHSSPTPPRDGRTKSTLEDRLRAATFAIGEASNATTPEISRKPSPSVTSVVSSHPLSPSSTPLPDSPAASPKIAAFVPASHTNAAFADPNQLPSESARNQTDPFSESQGVTEDFPENASPDVPSNSTPSSTESPLSPDVASDPLSNEASTDTVTYGSEKPKAITKASADSLTSEGPESTSSNATSVTQEAVPLVDTRRTPEVPKSSDGNAHVTSLEELQERLKQMEQRFTDVSISFKRLQAEKQAADIVLRDLTPLESFQDSTALRDHLQSLTSKTEIFQAEIKRLNGKLEVQEDRIEELRDTHRLESSSQSAQIEKLQIQVSEAEALIKAAQRADAQAEEIAAGQQAEIEHLHKDLERAKLSAKEEEEKRVKAISLLKTVRQKLVKAEKEKEDALRETTSFQEREKGEKEREQAERARLRNELDAVNAEREQAVTGLRAQFDKELANYKDRFEKELSATKGQYELEGASIKNTHTQEISTKDSQIRALEQSLSRVTKDKNAFFEDLQLRQAELESAHSHLESLQSQNTEYQYQLREISDRYALLKEDVTEAQREQEARLRDPAPSADEVARLLSTAEAKYESKISDLKRNLSSLEEERNDSEADWSRKLRDKTLEVDDLQRLVGSATRTEEQHEEVVTEFKAAMARLEGECRLLQEQLQEVRESNLKVREAEKSWKSQEQDLNTKIAILEQQVDEIKQREAQLRLGNKASLHVHAVLMFLIILQTLREELRKVQSSAALLDRQRNPGVGYWTSRSVENNPAASQTSVNYASGTGSRISSSEPRENSSKDEEVNLEYLRNVILQFLENKEMRLTASASEVVILLLSCVSDISQVSTAQAMVHFADANDLLQNFRLTPDARQVLETFVISLSLLIGDDAKAAREAQIMHTIQLALGKGNIHGPSSDTDIITFSLVLQHLVSYRAHEFGSGDGQCPVALLVALFRWAAWSPTVFYTQMFLSAFTCLSQSGSKALIWKAFIAGRLPQLLTQFENVVNADGVSNADWRHALQATLLATFRRSELVAQCDHAISRVKGINAIQEDEMSRSFSRDLLQSMIQLDLIPTSFAVGIDPLISNDDLPRLQAEAQDNNGEIEAYLESKFTPDTNVNDLRSWMDRVSQDVTSHGVFASVILKRFTSLSATFDVDALSHLCKVLYTYDAALDIMALHVKISDLISSALSFLDQYDCETVGDPQTAVSHLGDVVLFVQYTTSRFQLETAFFTPESRPLCSAFSVSTDAIHTLDSLSGEDAAAFSPWFKALFDTGSEGIEDSILRSTQPKTLLKISPTLFLQAIMMNLVQKIDKDTLNNGVSYFTGPLLNWTLVGIIKALIKDIQQKGFAIPAQIEILQTLLLSPSCPRPVLALCAPKIFLLLGHKKAKAAISALGIDIASIRRVVTEALGLRADENPTEVPSLGSRVVWENEPRQAIQAALASARTGKAPAMDVERCIKIMPPTKFLQLLWSELVISASVGEMENCRRIATFILSMPRSSSTPPLLPIFLHVVTPSLIFAINHQQPPEHTMMVELLITIVSSALTAALHLELGIRSVTGEHSRLASKAGSYEPDDFPEAGIVTIICDQLPSFYE
ncbi:hypothetical protein D9615_005338 [Tricholomella constricta]|uniref:Mediator of RNA polymerase II transcription subunit 5 n=1 Tax=Tricholomella constricta TaxID=117010 RepID=A0A8H5H6F3_9AGAR|nr:hypothetical protein D9615_005338 [Tricholomella constricta]